MKSPRWFAVVGSLALTFAFLFATPHAAMASAENQVDQAVAVSKNWVSEIDAGKYDESYSFGCDAMRQKVPQDRWVTVLKALRKPWGTVVNRKQLSHVYKPNGVPGLNGECMVITYETNFQHLDGASEVVVLKWEDGKWRGAGYNAGQKPNSDDAAQASSSSPTEIHTEAHVKAPPQ